MNEKNRENESLKSKILTFRQQLKFKVGRLRQFEELLQVPTAPKGPCPTQDEYSQLLGQKEKQMLELKRQVADRDKFIQQQVRINNDFKECLN